MTRTSPAFIAELAASVSASLHSRDLDTPAALIAAGTVEALAFMGDDAAKWDHLGIELDDLIADAVWNRASVTDSLRCRLPVALRPTPPPARPLAYWEMIASGPVVYVAGSHGELVVNRCTGEVLDRDECECEECGGVAYADIDVFDVATLQNKGEHLDILGTSYVTTEGRYVEALTLNEETGEWGCADCGEPVSHGDTRCDDCAPTTEEGED